MAKNENSQRRLKGYYGFQKKYPSRRGERPIHESRRAKKRERIKKILFCVFLCCLFIGVFIFAKFCNNLSSRPLDENHIETPPTVTADNIGTVRATYMDNSVLRDISDVMAFLEEASDLGFNAVLIDFKNRDGILSYKSKLISYPENEKLNYIDSETIARIKLEGFLVLGRIFCFEDTTAPQRLYAYVYEDVEKSRIWFDDSAINGGRVWLDPTNIISQSYICSVIKEVISLGADCIYLDSVQFPESREGSVPVYGNDDSILNRNLILMNFLEKAVEVADGRPVILGMPVDCIETGNEEKWGGTLFDTAANICSPLLEDPRDGNFIRYIENSYIVYNDKAKNNFSTVKMIPTVKIPVEVIDFYENLSSSTAESYIIIP